MSVDGRRQSTGTVSVPHSKPSPQSAHATFVLNAGSGAQVVVVGVGVVVLFDVVVAGVRADPGAEIDTVTTASTPITTASFARPCHARSAATALPVLADLALAFVVGPTELGRDQLGDGRRRVERRVAREHAGTRAP